MTFRNLLFVLCALGAPLACAQAPRQLTWEDLSVRMSAAKNPFEALTAEQLEMMVDIADVREYKARGLPVYPPQLAKERTDTAKLKKEGIDVDGLLARRDEIAAKMRTQAKKVNTALDGQLVRLPGYLLPLEFSGKQVTEFLLVPWVGACIHTPPPPRNQIVHVKSDKPFEMNGMFDAVWVTGRMATSGVKKSVYMIDGAADVDIGYSMRATGIELYKQ
jgi:hypothetical protein